MGIRVLGRAGKEDEAIPVCRGEPYKNRIDRHAIIIMDNS